MKRLMIILIMIGISYSKVCASSTTYYWENTIIDVQVNDDIEKYLELPRCILKIDGQIVTDDKLVYECGSEGTFISTISTTRVGTYSVYYTAWYVSYGLQFVQKITFHVFDKEKPNINFLYDHLEVQIKGRLPKISEYAMIFDNSNRYEDLVITIDDSIIQYNKCGEYILRIIAEDLYGNKTIKEIIVIIYDDEPPLVSLKQLNAQYGDVSFNVLDALFIKDNSNDDELTIEIIKNVNVFKLGMQEIVLNIYDSSQNVYSYKTIFEIIDTLAPIIEIKNEIVEFDVELFDYFDESILHENLIIHDNYDKNADISLLYEVRKMVGMYEVQVFASDIFDNESSMIFTLFLRQYHKPIINVDRITINQYAAFNINDYIEEDQYDPFVKGSVVILSNNVDTTRVGSYFIRINVMNQSGYILDKYITVNVIDEFSGDIPKKDNIFEDNIFIIIGIGVVFIATGIFYVYKHIINHKHELGDDEDE